MSEIRRANPLWRLYEIGVMFYGLGLLAVICLGSVPLFLLLYTLLPSRWRRQVSRRIIAFGFRNYLRALFLGAMRFDLDALTPLRKEGSLILVANHPSLLDAVMLLACLPNGSCIMKAKLLSNPLYGVGARMASYVSNEEPKKMIEDSCERLRQGAHFVLFPEGGRTREFPLSPLSSACLLIAKKSQTPIQTVIFEFSTPYLGAHWGLFNPPCLPLKVRARLGRRFTPEEAAAPGALSELEAYFQGELTGSETA